jgi:quercetin dioxygenase-like cupin family protein
VGTYQIVKHRHGRIDEALFRRILADEGYSVFCWTDAPGSYYSDHDHANDQSHWILSGSLELTVEGHGKFVLEAGDRDLMPAGTVHSARVKGNEPVVYLIGEKL